MEEETMHGLERATDIVKGIVIEEAMEKTATVGATELEIVTEEVTERVMESMELTEWVVETEESLEAKTDTIAEATGHQG